MDAFLVSCREMLTAAFEEMNRCLDGLTSEQVNWHPPGEDFNPPAVLAIHSLASTRSWLSVAVGADLPPRDRDAEFAAVPVDAESLRSGVRSLQDHCLALVSVPPKLDWAALRMTHARPDPGLASEVTGAWALMHAIEHLREHLGQMLLTRQLMRS